MSGSKREQQGIQKEEILQAVLIADDYDNLFSDYTKKRSPALLPVVGRYAIDYALEHLGRSGIQETIVFCSSFANEVKKHVANSHWYQPASPMKITFIISEKCESLGDAMRDIDHKAIIKGNFVLLNALCISNVKLLDVMKFHSEKCLKDKGTSMTLLLQDVGSRVPKFANNIFAVNATSSRLLQMKSNTNKKINVPLDCLLTNENINIFSNLMDTGITICSPAVPILFADNFDFQTKEDFINGILLNDDILDSRIYCYQLETDYGSTICDWQSYQRISNDIMHRWTFPLVPDQSFSNDEPFYQLRKYIYKQYGVQMVKSVNLEMDVVIGHGSIFEGSNRILRSVIGKNCHIAKNVEIQDSFIFDSCTIKENCKIRLSVLGEGSLIEESSTLNLCFLKKGVVVNKKSNLFETALRETSEGNKLEKKVKNEAKVGECLDLDSDDGLGSDKPLLMIDPDREYSEDDFDHSSASDSEESYAPSQEADDNSIFYTEVVESLHRGFEEKVPCENLILEINSSRYAYNVLLKDVTNLTVKAIFSIPQKVGSSTKAVLTHFLPLFKNYIKSAESQLDCITVMEEMFEELGNELTKSIHFLYLNDIIIEDVILKWHKNLEEDSPVKSKVAPLIKWLEEAAEESSEEDSD